MYFLHCVLFTKQIIFTYAVGTSQIWVCPHFLDLTGGARGEEAGGPSDQWEPCFETLIVLHFQLF